MLKFADCNIAVGQPNAISGWRIYDSAQIACQAQRCGIQKGLVKLIPKLFGAKITAIWNIEKIKST